MPNANMYQERLSIKKLYIPVNCEFPKRRVIYVVYPSKLKIESKK